eukprot:CAMPEP_0185730694 /NCGR_PEP_ID=MMETSP1171-20130828/10711_1 /TAXON_ID=374046 /ORGANISM="Helicotheca tamensis, Strain CCMP826" /LENGTH=419 /DNA_ID=CAMNT_0028399803 /DNA_START=45 /DNA_END=1304 /DNA_ORIENTATION=-
MEFDHNSDYPGNYNATARDPIPFDTNIDCGSCTRVAIAKVSTDTIWTRPPEFDGGEEKGAKDDDGKDDGEEGDEDYDDPVDVLVIKEGGEEGYWIGRTICDAICGSVRYAAVVRKCTTGEEDAAKSSDDALIRWDKTGEECAVKEMPHVVIRINQTRFMEDAKKEVVAMQYLKTWCNQQLGNDDTPLREIMEQFHVILPRDLLSDDIYLYSVMPYLNGGEFLVQLAGGNLTEEVARKWFQQMLVGLGTLQKAGICHHDISPENMMVHNDSLLIIDMGMCLRIPYEDDDDNSNNNNEDTHLPHRRCLIRSSRVYGKRKYMSPEVYKSQNYDGHAIDLWAVSVILYVMLIWNFPWEMPSIIQRKFPLITGGYLLDYFRSAKIVPQILSPDAADLLQRMLFRDPKDRLCLEQVWAHPWVANG